MPRSTTGSPDAAGAKAREETLVFADVVMHPAAYRVFRAGREVALGPTEFRLLQLFLRQPRRGFSRREIVRAVWPAGTAIDDRTVDVHIARLRRALNGHGETNLIRTIRSVGYSLDTPTSTTPDDT
ncbi:MAG: hypothetical protein EA406_12945 [Rhodospirillales bacterium]|nr:MAG: hypothetical protein EA406_12945 [Rhodospirillales bacterium]